MLQSIFALRKAVHFFELAQQPAFAGFVPANFDASAGVAPGPLALFLSRLLIWKTTLKALWKTLFRLRFSLAEHSTKP